MDGQQEPIKLGEQLISSNRKLAKAIFHEGKPNSNLKIISNPHCVIPPDALDFANQDI